MHPDHPKLTNRLIISMLIGGILGGLTSLLIAVLTGMHAWIGMGPAIGATPGMCSALAPDDPQAKDPNA